MSDRITGTLDQDISEVCIISDPNDNPEDFCYVTLETDSEYNNGATCFGPTEKAYFRVYSNANPRIKATSGNISKETWLPCTVTIPSRE